MSGLVQLARHAQNRSAAGGNALIRAQIFPISVQQPAGLGHNRFHGFPDQRGRFLNIPAAAAEAAAEMDDLAHPGPGLLAATALLVNELGQAFGVPEMGQLARHGKVRRRYWSDPQLLTWAEQNGIEITDERID